MNEENFQKAVIESTIPVVVYFYTNWCGACRRMEPIIKQLASEYEGKIKFVAIDGAKNPQAAAKYYIRKVPTFIIFIGGEPQEKLVGATRNFREWIEKWATLQSSTKEG